MNIDFKINSIVKNKINYCFSFFIIISLFIGLNLYKSNALPLSNNPIKLTNLDNTELITNNTHIPSDYSFFIRTNIGGTTEYINESSTPTVTANQLKSSWSS
ncbi:MAG: hypothetical protein LBM13_05110, partial [Candidatus Ancillula sp.]|nr:hypothetical protein [Candidatus Ancillula sp.]